METKKTQKHSSSSAEEGDFSRVLHSLEKNLKPIFIGLGVILVVLFASLFFLQVKGEKEEQAHLAFQSAYEDFINEERAVYDWRQSDENTALLEKFHDRFADIYGEYPQTTFGRESLFQTAKLNVIAEEYETAASLFQEYLSKAANEFEKSRALNGLGKTYESIAFKTNDNEKYQQAIEYYERIIDQHKNLTPFYWNALLNAGTAYTYLGELEKAEGFFQTLLAEKTDKNRDVPFFEEAQSRLDEVQRLQAMQ